MAERILTMGVVGTATKENEQRAPIYPDHFQRIDPELREHIYVERGYGERFGVSDETLAAQVAGLGSREAMFEQDIVLLPKPTEADFGLFGEGQVLWGWPHCVQGEAITQVGIDKRMTYIAWEAMHAWRGDEWMLHIFHKNNELAGYCSVLHAFQLMGITGAYGPTRRAAVIGFGATGRGAVHALRGQAIHDVTVFTRRPYHQVAAQVPGVRYRRYQRVAPGRPETEVRRVDGTTRPMAEALAEFDVVVNCILQFPSNPQMFVRADEIDRFHSGALIVDVSCDEGMGFDFACPTSFEQPAFTVGDGVLYYAVDHSPSYLWRAATYEISRALLPYVKVVMGGPEAWEENRTIRRAIEIRDGVVLNPEILRFQHRAERYPHETL